MKTEKQDRQGWRLIAVADSGEGDIQFDLAQETIRCDTCRWWEEWKRGDKPGGACRKIRDSDELTHGSKAVSVDCGGMPASLLTAPDFGCVQWEPEAEEESS